MKKLTIISLLLVAAPTVWGQNNDELTKRLEVTRAYTPRVEKAAKLPVEANMVDTTRLRPEISYHITPTPWPTVFPVRAFAPARVSVARWEPHRTLYLRAGAGYPLQSTVDLYYTPRVRPGAVFGVWLGQRGTYSRLTNDIGAGGSALETTAEAGIGGATRLGRVRSVAGGRSRAGRLTLAGDLSYDLRLYNPYAIADATGVFARTGLHPTGHTLLPNPKSDPITLDRVRGSLSVGDDFTDLARFNFRAGIEGSYSHGTDHAFVEPWVRLAMMPGPRHGFDLAVAVRAIFDRPSPLGGCSIPPVVANGTTMTLRPLYVMRLKRFDLRAGLDMGYLRNNIWGQNHLSFWPALEIRYNVADGAFVPFFTSEGQVIDGSREALTRINPYYDPGFSGIPGPTGWRGEVKLGVAGNVGDVFTYRVSGGVSKTWNQSLMTAHQRIVLPPDGSDDSLVPAGGVGYSPLIFKLTVGDPLVLTAGGELGLRLGGFSARVGGNYNHVVYDGFYVGFIPAPHLPRWDAFAEVSYRHRDRFSLTLGAKGVGNREFDTIYELGTDKYHLQSTIGPVVDLYFTGEVRLGGEVWLFVEGRNLANQHLYHYAHYRGLGANAMAGIKVVF